ncbi:MAG: ABC transporter ATP-binding protein [Pseudobdellovibrio sp.]
MKFIEVNDLKKSFQADFYKKPAVILKGISFAIPKGKFVGLIGPNGAGKTTTIKCLLQFIFPDSGHIRYGDNLDFVAFKKTIGYLPERPFFQEFLSGEEFLKLHWDLSATKSTGFSKRADEVLEMVKLSHAKTRKLKDYSKGMLQRIGIAQSLIAYPEFLILDEPMSGLDPDGRILIKDILKDLKRTGITVLMSSHLLEDIDELCEELVVIHQGECFFNGPLVDFKKDYHNLQEAYKAFKGQFEVNYNV